MRLSSEEASMSSTEIAPCGSEEVKEAGDSSFDHVEPNKYGAIVEEAIRETEILAKMPAPEKKRKVEESWITEQSSRKQRSRPKGKKLVIESSDEDDFVGDDSSDEEEFEIKPTKKSKVTKKETKPKEVVKRVSPRKAAAKKSLEPKVVTSETPKSPLREHNRLAALPKCQNMFQNKSPVKLKVTPRKEDPPPIPTAVIPTSKVPPKTTASPATPGLSSSLANILGKLGSKAASKQPPPASPVPSKALVTARTPVTPVQRKLPSWTPPAKAGTGGGSSALASPSIGLRVGLSRNHRGKPLHSSVKS